MGVISSVVDVMTLDLAHLVLMIFCVSVIAALSRMAVRLFHVFFLFSEPQFKGKCVKTWYTLVPFLHLGSRFLVTIYKPEVGPHFYFVLSGCIGTPIMALRGRLLSVPTCFHLHPLHLHPFSGNVYYSWTQGSKS